MRSLMKSSSINMISDKLLKGWAKWKCPYSSSQGGEREIMVRSIRHILFQPVVRNRWVTYNEASFSRKTNEWLTHNLQHLPPPNAAIYWHSHPWIYSSWWIPLAKFRKLHGVTECLDSGEKEATWCIYFARDGPRSNYHLCGDDRCG